MRPQAQPQSAQIVRGHHCVIRRSWLVMFPPFSSRVRQSAPKEARQMLAFQSSSSQQSWRALPAEQFLAFLLFFTRTFS
jgi:hypothetical protein